MNPIPEDLEFLSHYGVKGMQWGVRKERKAYKQELKRELRSVKKEIRKDNIRKAKKTAKVVGGLAVLAGAAVVISKGSSKAKDILSESGNIPVSKLSWSAQGRNKNGVPWKVEADNAHTFDFMMKLFAERGSI